MSGSVRPAAVGDDRIAGMRSEGWKRHIYQFHANVRRCMLYANVLCLLSIGNGVTDVDAHTCR